MQKPAYERLISDWRSDVCSSYLVAGDPGRAAVAHQHRHVLLSATGKTHRAADNAESGIELPQLFARFGIVRGEVAIGGALEYQIAGGRQHAAVPQKVMMDFPARLLRDRIPGQQGAGVVKIGRAHV